MNIVQDLSPALEELIQNAPTPITYIRNNGEYDPATGDVTANSTAFAINAGVLSWSQ